jgi:hypothetical protein
VRKDGVAVNPALFLRDGRNSVALVAEKRH